MRSDTCHKFPASEALSVGETLPLPRAGFLNVGHASLTPAMRRLRALGPVRRGNVTYRQSPLFVKFNQIGPTEEGGRHFRWPRHTQIRLPDWPRHLFLVLEKGM